MLSYNHCDLRPLPLLLLLDLLLLLLLLTVILLLALPMLLLSLHRCITADAALLSQLLVLLLHG